MGVLEETAVPLVGRVSMDLVTFDVSAVPHPDAVRPGAFIDLIGPLNPIDDLAARVGTIGYEILTSLGSRYARRHIGGTAPDGGTERT
jgi:alanine racemase